MKLSLVACRLRFVPLALTSLALVGCIAPRHQQTPQVRPLEAAQPAGFATQPQIAAGTAPQQATEPTWKERIEQPYVYLEQFGDYRELGEPMRRLMTEANAAGIQVSGAPFALFYDDPGQVDVARLRSRVCLPIAGPTDRVTGSLSYDVLPRAMVVYSQVRGAYPELPRVYPQLFAHLNRLRWTPGVPIREIYLVNPAEVASLDELVAEVQIPWSSTGG